jgi:hypothetical protein
MPNWEELFYSLLAADSEDEVLGALQQCDLLRDEAWQLLGGEDNNFAIVGNQHSEPTGALVEKVINSIDAKLMAACYANGVDPEGPDAPASMRDAVERFFGVRDGRLGDLPDREIRELAMGIQIVAVGPKDAPSYLIIDDGEGQTPQSFPTTFMSLAQSNKLRIPFVQGKFNSGGTAVLQFCGDKNLQLVASRRNPACPVPRDDPSRDQWGFTVVRRVEPGPGDRRRNSVYVYLAPGGAVPAFTAESIRVLPGDSRKGHPAQPNARSLPCGTVIKLYDYRWKPRSLATTDARFELEKYLHAPALPFRVTETRAYKANFYTTTVAGIWASIEADEGKDERTRVEPGFPATAILNLPSVGPLKYRIVVFKEDVDARRIPKGVVFAINGQVHGELPSDFVSRRLEFDYLRSHLLVSVDCTDMPVRVREDFFPAARDRVRRNETYDAIVARLESDLRRHPGLKEVNASRRSRRLQKALTSQEDVVQTLTALLNTDPALRALFELGDRLVVRVGPSETEEFVGRRFPTYFRLRGDPKGEFRKRCPVNRTCKVQFETDVANDYFDRSHSPGKILFAGDAVLDYSHLWNGIYTTRWGLPNEARPGDRYEVSVLVTDADREGLGRPPFISSFTITATEADFSTRPPGGKKRPTAPDSGPARAPRLALPTIATIRRTEWDQYEPPFTEHDALRVRPSGQGGFDYIVNLDNAYLLTELRNAKDGDKDLVVHWFKYGLAISAMGMLQHRRRLNGAGPNGASDSSTDAVNASMNGLASVIVPVIRTLNRGPQ